MCNLLKPLNSKQLCDLFVVIPLKRINDNIEFNLYMHSELRLGRKETYMKRDML